jgi:hypothetical protein
MRHLRTIALAAVTIVALGIAASGCGETAKAVGLPASGVTKTEAVAFAQAVNLTPADVPGMVSVSLEKESKPGRGDIEEARCIGAPSPLESVAELKSPDFRSGQGLQEKQVKSGVEVRPSAMLAAQSLTAVTAAVHNARSRSCLLRLAATGFVKAFAHRRNKRIWFSVGRLTLSSLPHSVSGSFGLRFTIPMTFGRGSLLFRTNVYLDAFGFVKGPAQVSLSATGYSSPVPSSTEQRLLSLLYSRA